MNLSLNHVLSEYFNNRKYLCDTLQDYADIDDALECKFHINNSTLVWSDGRDEYCADVQYVKEINEFTFVKVYFCTGDAGILAFLTSNALTKDEAEQLFEDF